MAALNHNLCLFERGLFRLFCTATWQACQPKFTLPSETSSKSWIFKITMKSWAKFDSSFLSKVLWTKMADLLCNSGHDYLRLFGRSTHNRHSSQISLRWIFFFFNNNEETKQIPTFRCRNGFLDPKRTDLLCCVSLFHETFLMGLLIDTPYPKKKHKKKITLPSENWLWGWIFKTIPGNASISRWR